MIPGIPDAYTSMPPKIYRYGAPTAQRYTPLHDRDNNTIPHPTMSQNVIGKRKVEAIDLTGSDDEDVAPTQSRKISRADHRTLNPDRSLNSSEARSVFAGQPTQAQRDQWAADGDEAGIDDLIASTQDGDMNDTDDMLELYGTLQTKIVGVRFYHGHATIGEHVIIRREPTNPYDSNAMRVDNVQRVQIGHIPRQMASKLHTYVDSGELVLEGTLAGGMGEFECPIAVKLFGTSDPAGQEELKNRMQADRLPIETLKEKEKEAKRRRAKELKKVGKNGVAITGANIQDWDLGSSQGEFAGNFSQGVGESSQQSLEDIMLGSERFNPREMGEVVEKFGAGEEALSQMPMANASSRLSTTLLPYQRQGLAWLMEKENPQLPPVGSTDVVQLWKRSTTEARVFTNIATRFSIKDNVPTLAQGGILADDMGLGKTLEIIALIVGDLVDLPRSVSAQDSQLMTTLIVAPLSVMSNWSGQVCAGSLLVIPTEANIGVTDCSACRQEEPFEGSHIPRKWAQSEQPK